MTVESVVAEARTPERHEPEVEGSFTIALHGGSDYVQRVEFDVPGMPPLLLDEPPPLGGNAGPNPSRVLASAVGGCLGASLMFCMRKARVDVRGIGTTVRAELARNARGRLRVRALRVRLEPIVPREQHDRVPRCLELFEEFCVVTGSIRPSIEVTVEVEPQTPDD